MYEPTGIAERIKSLAKKKSVQIKIMLEECGLSKNTLSSMQSGGSTPKSENLAKIADYLDCSVDYLLGRVDYPELIIRKAPPVGDAAADEYEIDKDATPLSPEEINELRQFLLNSKSEDE